MNHWTSSISEWQARSIAATFSTVLSSVIDGPNKKIDQLELVSGLSKAQLQDWNSKIPEKIETCVHDVFHENAANRPDAQAVCGWDGEYTYQQLDHETTRLAEHLRTRGVGPETLIPFCFNKSTWTIVAMLSILKAGGACVALDPSHPSTRHQAIIEDIGANLLLAAPSTARLFIGLIDEILIIDQAFLDDLRPGPRLITHQKLASPYNAAFVIYTSGSTGKPKGVVLEHSSVCTSVRAHSIALNLNSSSRVLQFAAYVFDVSLQDIFSTLMCGGCVCVPSEEDRVNNLAGFINKSGVNWACLTTTVSGLLQPQEVPGLRNMSYLGEPVTKKSIDTWMVIENLHNTYGPAECTICCTWNGNVGKVGKPSDIGHGLASLLWVVDVSNHDRLVPLGCVGELLVEGPLLSRGYLNDSVKTATSFIENPSWAEVDNNSKKPRRMYKTGDLVRYESASGNLIFMGRKDTQVKIHGQRIELGEVEHHVKMDSGASHVVVDILKFDDKNNGDGTLTAFLGYSDESSDHLDDGEIISMDETLRSGIPELEASLTMRLPSYMIPTMYIFIQKLPLNRSGKTDRKRLRTLAGQLTVEQRAIFSLANVEKRAPTSVMESQLRTLWGEVLSIEPSFIGVDDSFFRLGGDSVAAMRLVACAHKIGISLTVAIIFHSPTLFQMASVARYTDPSSLSHVEPFSLLDHTQLSVEELKDLSASKCGTASDLVQDLYQCTPLQEGLMALSMTHTSAYVAQNVFQLPSNLDLDRFKKTWESVYNTTDALRSRIIHVDGFGSLQVILGDQVFWNSGKCLQQYLDSDRAKNFACGTPLTRYAIIEEGSEARYFVWTAHHAIYDGWSMALILEKAEKIFESGEAQDSPSFAAFIQYLKAMDGEQSDRFWRDQFAAVEPPSFPPDLPASQVAQANASLKETIVLPRNSMPDITDSTMVRTAWALLNAKYSDSNDVVFGVTLAGRDADVADILSIIGPTVTTVPIRITVHASKTIKDLLDAVQVQSTQMMPFQHAGLQHIKQLSPDARSACEFRNLLIIQPGGGNDSHESSIGMRQMTTESQGFYTYPLVLECRLKSTGIDLLIDYDERVFSAKQIRRMVDQFSHVLQQLQNYDPASLVGDINMLSLSDKLEISKWNDIQPGMIEARVHDLFERQVSLRTDEAAVCAWDAEFTYGQLNRLSNRLAAYLVTLGVGSEVMVPLCFEKSAWTIVAMIAVLKAGGACVALDPSHPISRLETIIDDVDAHVLLSSSTHARKFDNMVDRVLVVDEGFVKGLPEILTYKPETPSLPSSAAFVIYTSGSTGKPKGVVLEHRSICTSIDAHGALLNVGPQSRVLQFAAYVFDVNLQDIFTTLLRGGCVCVPSDRERVDDLAGAINRMNVNQACLTTTVAKLIQPSKVPSLQNISFLGEAVTQEVIDIWKPIQSLHSTYGPAECTILCSWRPDIGKAGVPTNIGRAVASVLWVVDMSDHNMLTPIGCVGELLVEGPLLSRGYLNDPSKTAAAFIENPSWADVNKVTRRRFYKTGDLVRYDTDGCLIYLGRKDTQAKIRGQRIELGEVEHAIKQNFDAISHVSAELVKFQGRDEYSLTAFLCLAENFLPSTESTDFIIPFSEELKFRVIDLESALHSSLPSHMVPSMFVPMQRMPLNASGKTDRKKLRQLAIEMSTAEKSSFMLLDGEKRAPSTDFEHKLQAMWGKILNMAPETIGLDDNFFRLGGDSISAIRLVALAHEEKLSLTVTDIFRWPTLEKMSKQGVQELGSKDSAIDPFSLLAVQPLSVKKLKEIAASQCQSETTAIQDLYPCSPLQEGLMALSRAQSSSYMSQNVFSLPDTINLEKFRTAWESTVATTDALRTRIIHVEPSGSFQAILSPENNAIWRSGSNLETYLDKDRSESMEYGFALSRHAIIREGTRHFFVWSVHHAIYDGWSISLVLDKLDRAYLSGKVEPSTSLARFISYLINQDQTDSDQFWRGQLSGAHASAFPPRVSIADGRRKDASFTQAFDVSRRTKSAITMSTIIRAAWGLLVAKYSESEEAVFGATLTGRDSSVPNIGTMVGPTITTVPVRIVIDSKQAISELLSTVQNQSSSMIPYQHAGLQHIKGLSPGAGRACDFQSLLVVQPVGEKGEWESSIGLQQMSTGGAGFHTYTLVLECRLMQDKVELAVDYDERVLSTKQVQRLLNQLICTVRQMNTLSSEAVGEIDLFSEQDLIEVAEWNKSLPTKIEKRVHDTVKSQVDAHPDEPAVCAWDGDFNYAELDEMSSRLASHLRVSGIDAGIIVPICFEKSAWVIVAQLAVLKAGGVIVSLHPSHPMKRIRGILEDVKAKIILVSSDTAGVFDGLGYQNLIVDRELVSSLPEPRHGSLEVSVNSSDPAFIIYTSGSTGIPKGVVLEHGSVCTSVEAHGSALEIGPDSRVLQFAAYVFDISIQDIFTTLMRGGCVCIPSEYDRLNNLAGVINRMGVNVGCITPTVASLLDPADVPGFTRVILAGEALTQKVIDMWKGRNLNNCYGPAESTIYCSWNGDVGRSSASPSNIGHGLASLLWIAEAENSNKLAPVGCAGELLIEGPLLAREYLNDRSKTLNSFIVDPPWRDQFGGPAGRRLYKTGDLVRYSLDGTLDYLGRKDTQVKVYGQRLELGEIEHHVKKSLSGTAQVAVELLKSEDTSTDTLVAFVSYSSDVDAAELAGGYIMTMTDKLRKEMIGLEASLDKVLPRYAIPTTFVPLRSMPLNTSGKTDRRLLRQLAHELSPEQRTVFSLSSLEKRPPSTEFGRKMQHLWAKTLNREVDSIGLDDSFFRIGGDSIAAVRLVALAREVDISVTVPDIFSHPTLEEMQFVAKHIQKSAQIALAPFGLTSGFNISHESLLQNAASQCDLPPEDIQDIYPCSPLQEGLFALSRTQRGAYMAQNVFRLPANLDLGSFREAWDSVFLTTDILRAKFIHIAAAGTLQVIPNTHIRWQEGHDLQSYLDEDKTLPVDYGSALTRYAIITENQDTTYLVWTAHHAIYDGWSIPLILTKVESAYATGKSDQSISPASFIQYLENIDKAQSDTFWKQQLEGSVSPVFPPSNHGTRMDRSIEYHIDLSRQQGSDITTSTVLRAAWAMLTAQYAGSDEAIFGAALTGRNAPVDHIESIVGPTITTVPVRIRIDPALKISKYLESIQRQATTMIPYEHAGLQHIMQLNADCRNACVFQNLLVIQPAADSNVQLSPLGLEHVASAGSDFYTYSLVLECHLHQDAVKIVANYDEAVISRTQMRSLLAQFKHVLDQLSTGPQDHMVSEVDLISPHDRAQLSEWNRPVSGVLNSCVHSSFETQVARRSEYPAILAWDAIFTYGELNDLATKLAGYLVGLGVEPETIIPLCFEKSAWAVVAQLAVLKAGGAVVSLDPTHPVQRYEHILRDINAPFILVGADLEQRFATFSLPVVVVDHAFIDSSQTTLPSMSHSSGKDVQPNNAAFVIYTSGSTGVPKGVVLTHSSICTSINAHGNALKINPDSRVLQFAAYVFDISIQDIFTTLLRGGCVCIPSESDRVNSLAETITRMEVNFACLTPTVASLLSPADVPTLKTLVLAGEAVTKKTCDIWVDSVDLKNCYGPAESTIYCACNEDCGKIGTSSNIGRGLSSLLWVVDVDDHNKLAPIGCIGELLIEGPLLAREYLGDPEKTMASFIWDPDWSKSWDNIPGPRRMYKTGDLVRYDIDGTLDYIGRKDSQIKIHGQRLELGEVESCLLALESVRNAVVMMPKEGPFQGRLVAIIEPDSERFPIQHLIDAELQPVDEISRDLVETQCTQIRESLAIQLPSYMMPSLWISVEKMPLNTSRKQDRARLARWLHQMDDLTYHLVTDTAANEAVVPTTSVDRGVQRIIAMVLNTPLEKIQLNRSFLAHGGDSITAMQVVSQARIQGLSLRVQDVLRSKTVSEIALVASKKGQGSASPEDDIDIPFDLSPVQEMYFAVSGQKATHFNQSFLLRLSRRLHVRDILQAIEAVVRQHSMLRARFAKSESTGRWTQVITKDVVTSYRFKVHSANSPESITAIVAATQSCLDIENGPLFAVDLINIQDNGQLLFLAAHHLIIDLVSWRILLRDLEEILTNGTLSSGRPFPFQAWLKLQAEYARHNLPPQKVLPYPVSVSNASYWQMENRPNLYGDVESEKFILDSIVTASLLGESHDALGTEPQDLFIATLLAAFSQTFNDRGTPTVFTEGHGREPWDSSIDISETVGWFTTMSPLHVPLSRTNDLVSALRMTKDLRRKLPGNGWPYFSSRYLNVDGKKAFDNHFPMEMLFNYLGRYQQLEREDGLLRREPLSFLGDIDDGVPRLALFEVSVVVVHDIAQFSIAYNRHTERKPDIKLWVQLWEKWLKDASLQLTQMPSERTLSDLPLLSLTYEDLHSLRTGVLPNVGVSGFENIEDIYPCSPMQLGLLLNQGLGTGNYEVGFTFEVTSSPTAPPVDAQNLIHAWVEVVKRHAALRTMFIENVSQTDHLAQAVLKSVKPNITKLVAADGDALKTLSEHSSSKQDQLQPPHHLVVCEHELGMVYMHLSINHALIDAASLSIIVHDVTLAYQNLLPEASNPSYSKYLAYLQGLPQDGMDYWKDYLRDIDPCHFPTLHAPAGSTNILRSVDVSHSLNSESLREFCSKQDVTVASVLKAAWGMVLKSYTGSNQVCFGYLSSGRDIPIDRIDEIVGPFINMLVCRMNVSEMSSTAQALAKVQTDHYNALDNQHCSLANIQHELGLSGTPLFNTIMSIQRVNSESDGEPVLSFKNVNAHDPTEYDITVSATDSKDGLKLSLSYWAPKISEWQAKNIAGTFATVLESLVRCNAEETLLSQVKTVSNDNLLQMHSWNSQQSPVVNSCIHEIVKQQVLERPHEQAICSWDADYTFLELDTLSTRLSYFLQTIDIGPETFVPYCFEKSALAIVTMLAILKAGGACVPLDPSHPMERLGTILQDIKARALLTTKEFTAKFTSSVQDVIAIDQTFLESLPTGHWTSDSTLVSPKNAAFVIYTSGSTGVPKGVILEHKSVCTSVEAHGSVLQIGPGSRVLQFAAYIFDISISDIFATLMRGGCVCVPTEHDRINDLAGAINRTRANFTCITPTVAALLTPTEVPDLKTLVLAGEAVSKSVIDIWAGKVNLNNCYGPAESTIYSTWNGACGSGGMMPSNIGRGLSSLLWVADTEDNAQLAPLGSVGELFIEGPLLSRGYLNDPEKTTASFIENPPWVQQMPSVNRRMYKTGDLVRYNSDGSLDYLGRKDSQVKINGQRLELGEVEHHLSAHEDILRAIALVPIKGQCKNNLVAIVEMKHAAGQSSDDIQIVSLADNHAAITQQASARDHVARCLPAYMIPTIWISVKQIPLNTSGKLDRARMTRWVQNMDMDTYRETLVPENEGGSKPATTMEQRIQHIVSGVLNIPAEQVSLNRPFLNLGGDSISAMQVISRARAAGITMKVQDVLQSKAITQLALLARDSSHHTSTDYEDEIGTLFDLSPVQKMYFEKSGQRPSHFNQSFFLRLTREVNPQDLIRAVRTVVKQHAMLRSRFSPDDFGHWKQCITEDHADSYRMNIHKTLKESIATIIAASQSALDVRDGPVFSADFIDIPGDGLFLFLAAHHLVVDLVSWRIILQDLEEILSTGSCSSDTPFPFQHWVKMQADYAEQNLLVEKVLPIETPSADLEYWGMRDQPNYQGDIGSQTFILDPEATELLLGKCQAALRTEPIEIFIATLLWAFSRVFDDRVTPTLFNEGHGREPWTADIDLSRTVGWFTTLSPLHASVESGNGLLDVIRRIKDTRRGIPANGWQYFSARYLSPKGAKAFEHHRDIEILFNYLGRYQQLERDDALLSQEPIPHEAAALDVGLKAQRFALFDVSVGIMDGRAQFRMLYNTHMKHQDKLPIWMTTWEQSLKEAVSLLSNLKPEYTLSDFPLLPMTYTGLAALRTDRIQRIGVASLDDIEDVYPCSPMQRGLLLSQAQSTGSYEVEFLFEAISVDPKFAINAERIIETWSHVVDRHAALRTVFVESVSEEGLFDQIVLKHSTPKTVHRRCRDDKEAMIALNDHEAKNDISTGPRHRLTVCETDSGRTICKFEINHAIIDAASFALILRDLGLAYRNKLPSGPKPLYSDYIRHIQERTLKSSLNYWAEYLEGIEPCHFPRTGEGLNRESQLKTVLVELDVLPENLHSFCDRAAVTVANVLQSVWGLILRYYTGSEDVCFGCLSSGREIEVQGIEDAVGPYVNMLICRMSMSSTTCVADLVQSVRSDFAKALEHQHCSLADIQHSVNSANRALFNTSMSIQRQDRQSAQPEGVQFRNLGGHDPSEVSKKRSPIEFSC